jgi:DNA-binding SARP family transcriptional activator
LEFRILGPLEVVDGGRPLRLRGTKQRALLAVLVLHANHALSRERLIDELWGTQPPESGPTALQVRVSQLRKSLGAAKERLLTHPGGYELRVESGELDLHRFERLLDEARQATAEDDPALAARALREALALWRGPAFADLQDEPFAPAAIARLAELRAAALEQRIEADLSLGRHAELVPELEALVGEHPLRERLRGQLMLALYRSGRQADALAAFQETRRLLVEELGIEPGPRLQEIERAILVQHPSLEAPATGPDLHPPVEERKLVTVLVAGAAAGDDPERWNAWLGRLRTAAAAEIQAAGGTVQAGVGGVVIGVFGAPAAQEDHVERALAAADALRGRLGEGFPLRVGLETGEVIVDGAGVAGAPVAIAAGLEQSAGAGETVLGERALAFSRARRVSAFVGRDDELGQLRAAYRRSVEEGRPHLATIVGDAGVGKSRLVRELWQALAGEVPAPRLRAGRCLSYGQGLTYRPLGEILLEEIGLRESDSAEAVLERLGGRETLGLVLGLDVAPDLHPLVARDRLRDAWVECVTARAREGPVALLVEDVHWAHDPLFELLERLLDSVRGPLFLVCTARPELTEVRPSWGRRRDAVTLWLEPLAAEAVELMLADVPEDLRERVAERGEGNPFFIEELVELGQSDATVPDTVQAVLAARIDLLSPAAKATIQAASVMGRVFWPGPLRELLDGEPALAPLEERDFVRPRAGTALEGERELFFKHALTREVAYSSVPRAARARLHARFAAWIERFGEGRDEHAAFLAHHFAEAVRPDATDLAWGDDPAELSRLEAAALEWLRRAAELAVGRYEIDEALALLHRALELEETDAARCDLWRSIGRANALKFDGEAFWKAMEAAIRLAPDDATAAEITSALALDVFMRSGMWVARPSVELVESWIARAAQLAEPGTPTRARALVAAACADLEHGAPAAAEALAIAERHEDPELLAVALDAVYLVARAAGDYEEACRVGERRLGLLDRISDPDLQTDIVQSPIPVCIATCRFTTARELARRHDELTAPLTPHHRVHGVSVLAEVEELLGGWEAIRSLESRIEAAVAENAGTPCTRNERSLLLCAVAAAYLGDDAAARRLEVSAEALDLPGKQVLDTPRLRLALHRGDRDRAEELLGRMTAERGWYSTGHSTSLATLTTQLDGLAALGSRAGVEERAEPLLRPGTFLEPFALRALGRVRGDDLLIGRALERFEALDLEWHAAETRALLRRSH